MQIKKGKYILNSDKSCYWVSEIKTSKQGKEYEVIVSGYHRKIADLADSFIEGAVRGSEAEDIKNPCKRDKQRCTGRSRPCKRGAE